MRRPVTAGVRTSKGNTMAENTVESAKQEMLMLRQELNNLKTCQFTFLTTAFTATGLLLGFVPRLVEPGYSYFGLLIPLVVVLPASCFFFDKARTITRIVGYYRHLERLVNPGGFPSWENALARSRSAYGAPEARAKFTRVMCLRQPHGYWSLAFYTFTALSLVCLSGAWGLAFTVGNVSPFRRTLLTVASVFVVICILRNLYLIWHLTVGDSSYEANFTKWERSLMLACDKCGTEETKEGCEQGAGAGAP